MKVFFSLIVVVLSLPVLLWLAVVRPLPWSFSQETSDVKVDPASLQVHVEKVAVGFFPRDWRHDKNLKGIAEYVAAEFRRNNSRVELVPFEVVGKTYYNVVSYYGPQSGPLYVLGAHYDAFEEFPGADDNASGVAGLLELGRLLGENPPRVPIQLVAYCLEEPPFFFTEQMGSAVHAESLRKENAQVELMIALEMIGFFSDSEGSQEYPAEFFSWFYPSKGNFIAIVGLLDFSLATVRLKNAFLQSTRLPVYSVNAPRALPGIDFSDHLNFWNRGYDAVMITDTAFLRSTAYHTRVDTPDRLDYERMAEVVRGVYSFLRLR